MVATRSADKLREIREILAHHAGLELVDLTAAGISETPEEEEIEAFHSFRENALAKARFFAARVSGLTLADDSGICVDALGGAPGVRSKRFSGRTDLTGRDLDRANNELLLERLRGVPAADRGARYVCAVALVDPDGQEAVVEGECAGRVLEEPRGGGGFGYDPLFLLPDEGATFAELSRARKNQVSHRAHAVRRAAEVLRQWGETTDPARLRG